ncbi:MAG: HAMP domain-containing histidine kinase [Dinghuibacter sp.]|nr:HAMP domain-containing histidine kinase [Dinghuibacter sp.]
MSIRYKIALLFAALTTLILLIAGFFVYFFSVRELKKSFAERLKNRAWATAKIYASVPGKNYSVLNKMDDETVASLYNRSISVLNYTDTYDYVYSSSPGDTLLLTKELIEKIKVNGEYLFTYNNRAAFALHKTDSISNFILAIAATDINGRNYLGQLKTILFFTGLAGIFVSFFAGLFFARNLTRPIKKIIGEVNRISTNNLSQRLKVNDTNDELNGLAITLNTLLDRLQNSFAIQRRFISNASHELSTPLTSISSQLEVAMQKSRSGDEYRNVINSVYEDIKDLHLLTHSLLDIAKAGSQGSIDLNEVRIDELLLKVAADVQKLQQGYRVTVEFENFPEEEALLTVFGNSNLLYIAFRNIIENGCKYSVNTTSSVVLNFNSPCILVSVTSKGDTLNEEELQNIFQPFFRTEQARQKQGFGLGLTLVKRILSLHRSTITATSSPASGTIFTVQLPNRNLPV